MNQIGRVIKPWHFLKVKRKANWERTSDISLGRFNKHAVKSLTCNFEFFNRYHCKMYEHWKHYTYAGMQAAIFKTGTRVKCSVSWEGNMSYKQKTNICFIYILWILFIYLIYYYYFIKISILKCNWTTTQFFFIYVVTFILKSCSTVESKVRVFTLTEHKFWPLTVFVFGRDSKNNQEWLTAGVKHYKNACEHIRKEIFNGVQEAKHRQ